MSGTIDDAVAAIRQGGLVVYPTETVYGLGANALDPDAIVAVFEAKGRSRARPISLAVSDRESIEEFAYLNDRERDFCRTFLPGPVTVLLERRDVVPDVLVGGGDTVGVRVPDHDLAQELLRRAGPLTATSANRSGHRSARRVSEIDQSIRERVVVLDGGETLGTESTVVDVSAGEILRDGALADTIDRWLQA